MSPAKPTSGEVPGVSRRGFIAAAAAIPLLATAAGRAAASTKPPKPAITAPTIPPAKVAAPLRTAAFVQHGVRTSRCVALTFHGAGSPALASQVLVLTKQLKAPVTVFAVGNWVEAHPDLATAFHSDGHELANHTYSHPALRRLDQTSAPAWPPLLHIL